MGIINRNDLDYGDYEDEGSKGITRTIILVFTGVLVITGVIFLIIKNNSSTLTFKEKSMQLEINTSEQLLIKEKVKNVKFKSSDDNIAFVNDEGYVTGVNEGVVTITAYVEGNDELKDECFVTVFNPIINPTNIILDKTSISLNVGNTYQLNFSVTPVDATIISINWKSDNANVATVNEDGLITAKSKGTANITVSTANNLKATCKVTVNANNNNNNNNNNNKFVLTYNANGGSVSPANKTLNKGSEYGTLPTPTRSGYKFDGWYTKTDGGDKVSEKTVINGNTTIYAHWTKNTTSVPVTSISLNKTSANVKTKRSLTLVATISPSNATDKDITWTSSNTSVAKVDSKGHVTGLKMGDAVITATTKNGKTAKANIKVLPLKILIVGNSKTYRTSNKDMRPAFNFVDLAKKSTFLGFGSGKLAAKVSDGSNYVGLDSEVVVAAKNGNNIKSLTVDPFKKYVNSKTFDVVIIQEKTSVAASKLDPYYKDVVTMVELLGGKNYKGRIYLRTSWPENTVDFNKDLSAMNDNAKKVAEMINKNYGIKTYVINDGNAFKKALDNKISVYTSDKNHQNINGAYLSALCMYTKVYSEDATKVKTNLYVTDSKVADKLKTIANSECK